jgi:Do/DeqQ family serine protease
MRRLLLLLLVAGLLTFGYHRWKERNGLGYGLHRVSEKYTPADGPRIDLKDVQVLAALDAEYARLMDSIVPSVVSVSSRAVTQDGPAVVDPFELFFRGRRAMPSQRMKMSLGSGVIVSKEGHILTNEHVVQDTREIQVQLTDGRVEPAQLLGTDPETDIAVIKISTRNITPLPLGDSDAVRVGQIVFAVGNPFGLHETVTQGIISAKGRRTMRDSSVEFLQTDAAVNRGNSGGPLLNLRGEVIGINSAIYSETGGWAGISFAVPSNTARRALESLIKSGRVVRTYLGVAMQDLTPDLAQSLGLHETRGALVIDVVAGSPAEKAGLQRDDVIRAFNDRPINDILALRSRIAEVDPGKKVELTIMRGGKEQKVTVEVAEAPPDFAAARPKFAPPNSGQTPNPTPNQAPPENVLASIQVAEIPTAMRERLPDSVGGVMITQIQPDTDAATKLQPGDVIEEINQEPIASLDEYRQVAARLRPQDKALLYVVRGRSRAFIVISPR